MRRNMLKFIGRVSGYLPVILTVSVICGVTILSGCNKDGENKEPDPTETLLEILQSREGLDSLAKYITVYPDIMTQLNSSGQLTLFAPNNEAFANLMATPGFPADISLINPDIIKGVLFYHILLTGAYTRSDLAPGEEFDTGYPGEKIEVNEDGTLLTGATNKAIEIVDSDIKATNGIMHVTGSVLIPPTIGENLTPILGTVAGTLLLGADFSKFAAAILRADSSVQTGQAPLTQILSTQNVTVFAPPNQVFDASGLKISDLQGQQWRAVVMYHMISGTVESSDLTQRSYETLLGENLYVSGGAYINGYPIAVPDAAPGSNGTIHILAGLLFPGLLDGGDLAQVAAFQGFDSLAVALQLTGLDDDISAPAGPFTVFAPPNEAFVQLLGSMSLTSLSQVPVADLTGIISHHIVTDIVFTSDMIDGGHLSTMSGIDLTIHFTQNGANITDGSGADTSIEFVNLKATNGVIHVIGGILIPQ